jgi:HK97 gp10 family phage protein
MKEFKSIGELIASLKICQIAMREDMQTALKSTAEKLVDTLNEQLEDDATGEANKNDATVRASAENTEAGSVAEKAVQRQIEYALRGDAVVIGSDDDDVVARELGSGAQRPQPFLETALIKAVPEIEKKIGVSLTATLAGEA